jgi:hypothetical protein
MPDRNGAAQPAASIIHARLKGATAELADDQNFAEGHRLDPETASRVPKEAIGRRLSQDEAAELRPRALTSGVTWPSCKIPHAENV